VLPPRVAVTYWQGALMMGFQMIARKDLVPEQSGYDGDLLKSNLFPPLYCAELAAVAVGVQAAVMPPHWTELWCCYYQPGWEAP